MKTKVIIGVALILILAACSGADSRKLKYFERGNELVAEKNFEKAQLEFKNALQIDPKYVDARFALAETLQRLNEWRPAVQHYLAVLELEPDHAGAKVNMAQIYLMAGDTGRAYEMVEEVLQLDPNNASALATRGGIHQRNGVLTAARIDASAALELEPENILAISLQAALHLQERDIDAATKVIKTGISRNEDNNALYFMLANIYSRAEQYSDAVLALEHLYKSVPEEKNYAYRLAYVLGKAGEIKKGESVLREVIAEDGENVEAKKLLIGYLEEYRGKEVARAEFDRLLEMNSDDAAIELALADWHLRDKEVDKAQSIYEELIDHPNNTHAIAAKNQLAKIYISQEKSDQAQTLVEQVLEVSPTDYESLWMHAAMMLVQRDAPQAIADYRTMLKDKPADVKVMRRLAQAYLLNGQRDLAKDTIEQAVKADEGNNELRLLFTQMQIGDEEYNDARENIDKLLGENEEDLPALQTLAGLQGKSKDWSGVEETAQKIVQIEPDRGMGYYLLGLAHQGRGELDTAEQNYKLAIEKEPKGIEPLSALIKMYIADRQYDQAENFLDQFIAKEKEYAPAHNFYAEISFAQKKFDEAIRQYEKAIAIAEKWWVPYRGLAVAHANNGDLAAAENAFEKGLGNGADIERLGVDYALFLHRQGRIDDAVSQYNNILQELPDSKVAKNNLAMLLLENGKGQADLERAKSLVKGFESLDDPAYLDTLGWAHYKTGDAQAAIRYLERAVSYAPDASELRYHLGSAYAKNGDVERAKENLQLALNDDRAFRWREEAEGKLSSLQ